MSVAAMILAAGGSRRLGRPKQTVEFQNETLLNRAIRIATEAGAWPVIAVLGAGFEVIRATIEPASAIVVYNDRWRQGIASSIHEGLRALESCAPDATGVLMMSCDQPRLTADHLRALIAVFGSQSSPVIAASSYSGVHGVPAVFPREVFPGLRTLQGDKGARAVIEACPCPVLDIVFPGGEIDIDSPQDLAQLT